MPSLDFHLQRREALFDAIDEPVLLMAGGYLSRNYPANPYGYRPDSSFLYFFAKPEADAAALLDPATREVTLFLHERTPEDALWHGTVPSFEEMRERHGVRHVATLAELEQRVQSTAAGRTVHTLAVADAKATAIARRAAAADIDFYDDSKFGSAKLIQVLAGLRSRKQPEEIEEMRRTARITDQAHRAAMAQTRHGVKEEQLAGAVTSVFANHGCVPAYNTILSVRGEVLHNNEHNNICRNGDIVLLDAGAEAKTGYCSDVTRCWPVSGRFTPEAADIYDTVLRAEIAAIHAVKPGVRYRDLHMTSARVVAEGLVDMGILNGDVDGLLEQGAQALFFPHGVGHLIGLDVHDMEGFGDQVHYAEGRQRSEQFGTAYLRLDIDVQPGMTFTIEPGIYFVPAILRREEFRTQFGSAVNWERCEQFLNLNDGRGFGGIRIEDDILATDTAADVLTAAVPKARDAVEALVATA